MLKLTVTQSLRKQTERKQVSHQSHTDCKISLLHYKRLAHATNGVISYFDMRNIEQDKLTC